MISITHKHEVATAASLGGEAQVQVHNPLVCGKSNVESIEPLTPVLAFIKSAAVFSVCNGQDLPHASVSVYDVILRLTTEAAATVFYKCSKFLVCWKTEKLNSYISQWKRKNTDHFILDIWLHRGKYIY
ncbi:hypothetical protein BsWGS_05116 [Bradybaena similaris]